MFALEAVQPIGPRWEIASDVLEIIAFFLVTVDLYGEERLRELNTRSRQLFTRLRLWLRLSDRSMHTASTTSVVINTFGHVGLVLICSLVIYSVHFPLDLHPWPLLKEVLALALSGLSLILGILVVLTDISYLLSSIVLYLLSKRNVRGLFLITGTFIFLVSKAISMMKAVYEIRR